MKSVLAFLATFFAASLPALCARRAAGGESQDP